MNIKPPRAFFVHISEVDKLKDTIKLLEKENADLRSDLGRLTQEKEYLKINLNQKRERMLKAIENFQDEEKKRRGIVEDLKGTYVDLSTKKK